MKLKVNRFRTRRPEPVASPAAAPAAVAAPVAQPAAPAAARAPVAPPPPPRPAAAAPRPQNPVVGDDAFQPQPDDDGFAGGPFPTAGGSATGAAIATPGSPEAAPMEIDAIRREGLTGRQLRMARRLAQKHNLPATSDFDAVRLLRARGIDPFQGNAVLGLVADEGGGGLPPPPGSRALTVTPGGKGILQLPQTISPVPLPSPELRAEQTHIAEVGRIQRDIARRRRRRSALLMARLFVFVILPTILAGVYYYTIATPLYSTKTAFVIQQAEPAAAAGMSSLLRGTPMASSQDSIAVQGYLQSQVAMSRLEADNGFRAHFSAPDIDPIQRIPPDASEGEVYRLYRKTVKISYDPTEGVIQMETIAADPQKAVEFAEALIGYAEEQVDQMTLRLRDDQMKGALEAYNEAEAKLADANRRVVELQERFKTISSEVEVSLITSQIGQLEGQLTQDKLSLAQMESNESPNAARMEPLKRRITTLEEEISRLRAKLTEDSASGLSVAKIQSELLMAQADVQTRQMLLASSLQAMESSRVEANRQTRYLAVSVAPVAPDEASYPRAFENTLVVLLIFTGVYLMISMTVAILREQVTA
ncbi:capsule polysaccharide transporter [Paracoccaceae bacterium]